MGARDLDRLGNNGADEAADFGRRRVPWWIIDALRIFLGFVLFGVLRLFSACIGSLLPLLGLLSFMMVWLVLLWTLWFGLRVVPRRGVALFTLFVIVLFFLGLLESGRVNGVLLLCLVLLVVMLSYSRILSVGGFSVYSSLASKKCGSGSWWCLLC